MLAVAQLAGRAADARKPGRTLSAFGRIGMACCSCCRWSEGWLLLLLLPVLLLLSA
jgi:hypothetical protein